MSVVLVVECILSIPVPVTFVTEKGFYSSEGEIRYENWFSFDDFVQKSAENSEKTLFLVEKFAKNH